MSKELENGTLEGIQSTLEEIKSILLIVNKEKLAKSKESLLKEGTVKNKIYKLCDGTKTTQDIAQIINESYNYVSSYISIMRREGLIRTVKKEDNQVYEQIF